MLNSKRRAVAVAASVVGVLAGGAVTLARAPGAPPTSHGHPVPSEVAKLEQQLRQEQGALANQTKQVQATKSALAAESAQLTAEANKLRAAAAKPAPVAHATTGASGAPGGDGGGGGGDN